MTMGGKKYNWRDYLAWGLLLLSVFTLVWATAIDHSPGNTVGHLFQQFYDYFD